MHIGPLGLPEIIIIIVVIIAIIGGPKIIKKIGRQGKKTLAAGKKGIENASKEISGKAAEAGKVTKDNVLDGINKMQDRIDEKFDEINEDGTPKKKPEEKPAAPAKEAKTQPAAEDAEHDSSAGDGAKPEADSKPEA